MVCFFCATKLQYYNSCALTPTSNFHDEKKCLRFHTKLLALEVCLYLKIECNVKCRTSK